MTPSVARRTAGLDGIRAFAVLAVVAFHFGVPGLGGGSLGVDMFFVLSGYLITSLLVREHNKSGTVGRRAFWARRARRLFPALFVLLIGVVVYAHFNAANLDLSSIRGDALATLLYVANWHFILTGQNYFSQSLAPSPLLHTWTLGVEEQYYLIWPVVALAVLNRWGTRALARTAATGAVLSGVLMGAMYVAGFSINRLYYGTDTRAQALLIGSFIGAVGCADEWQVLPERWRRGRACGPVVVVLGLAGAGFLGWACDAVPGTDPLLYEGGFFVVAIAVALVITMIVTVPASAPARFFALPGLTYIGRISYGVYLYHWPVFLGINHAHTGMAGAELLWSRIGITFAAAIVSFELWEKPVRDGQMLRSWRAPASVVAAGSVVIASVVAVTLPTAESTQPTRNLTASSKIRTAPPPFTLEHPVKVLMTGDSLALTLALGLSDHAARYGVDYVTGSGSGAGVQLGCDLDPGSIVDISGVIGPEYDGCPDWRITWAALVQEYDPDVVTVLLGRWEIVDRIYDGRWTHIGEKAWDEHLEKELLQAVRILSARGAKVVLFTMPYVDPPTEAANGSVFPENLPSRVVAYNELVEQVAAASEGRASVIDLNRMLDPAGHYTQTLDGVQVRWSDGIHISLQGGELLQSKILPQLVSLGISHDLLRNSR